MIDGGFRKNTYGATYFSQQDFPENDFEVIWIDYYDKPSPDVMQISKVKVIKLGLQGVYHSSHCFNRGILEAHGDIIIIADADQIVKPNFLTQVYRLHSKYSKLAIYGYRYDEIEKGAIKNLYFDELEKKCIQKNTVNYGACLTIRKKWLLEINGYEQHSIFKTGCHANGLDIYTRLKNFGLAIKWEPSLKLFHPWHPFTLMPNKVYESQLKFIEWRKMNMQSMAFEGIIPSKNKVPPISIKQILENEMNHIEGGKIAEILYILKKQKRHLRQSIKEIKNVLKEKHS